MWDKIKLLLAAIIFTALYCKVTAEGTILKDMAPDSVDNQYKGCPQEALKKLIQSGLLQQELRSNELFQKAWNASNHCTKLIPGGIKEHTAALLAYINGDAQFISNFNNAVKTMGVNVSTYEDRFPFKSLHFLLMDSIKLLYPKKCKTLYLLSEEPYTTKQGSNVRVGGFIKVDSNYEEVKSMEDLDGMVIFNITSCFFANLGNNICSDEGTALLSPAEVFTVEYLNRTTNANRDQYTEVVLKHSELDSSLNCFSRSPADVSTQWLVLVLVASSLFFFH
ncbi:ecto-ADP-ribosyltransferase 5 [Morone saxatilis]|uniref:ecto-ADP-ribosyltransferase 5 n=1 Tax=Morone saxatilis TaxID=34816 RepID=UPI0015E1E318|nr:ecto-ADP-ribosyltransferase 5 [Morone saxatilis]